MKVNSELVHISDNAVHLGNNISTSDCDSMILAATKAFWKSYNISVSNFGDQYSLTKLVFLHQFVAVFMGDHCGC